jgi:hypothetical protein
MVGSGIPYSPFKRAATRPKLKAMQFSYRVRSNFITVAPPKFEDFLTLRLCMNPKFNGPNCHISKQGFKQANLPDQVHNETVIRMRMTKLCPLLEAQNLAIIGCKSSLDTRQSHDYLQYKRCAYHRIAAFSGGLNHNKMAVYTGILCYT